MRYFYSQQQVSSKEFQYNPDLITMTSHNPTLLPPFLILVRQTSSIKYSAAANKKLISDGHSLFDTQIYNRQHHRSPVSITMQWVL